jgi:hypothetical protein
VCRCNFCLGTGASKSPFAISASRSMMGSPRKLRPGATGRARRLCPAPHDQVSGDWRDVRAQSIQRRTSNEHLKHCDRQCEGQIPQARRFLGRRSTLVAGPTRSMEKTMIRMAALVLLLALISFAAVAQLTKGRSSTAPGQVGARTAPDQQQMAPGDAKTFAPGQQ